MRPIDCTLLAGQCLPIRSEPLADDAPFAYLDRARELDFFVKLKAEMLDALRLGPGERIADVGCGTGEDAVAAAGAAQGIFAVGYDLSSAHVAEARRRHANTPAAFLVADARSLPIADQSLDACLVERTLQHVADPGRAVMEIARSLRPGGRLVISEPDWESCVVAGADPTMGAAILGRWTREHNRNPRVGRDLAALLVDAGLRLVIVRSSSVIYRDFGEAELAFPLRRAAESAARGQIVSRSDAETWISDLKGATKRGKFLFAVPVFTALAVNAPDTEVP